MGDAQDDRVERVIQVNDQEYLVTRAIARMKIVHNVDDLPPGVAEQTRATANQLHWTDESNPDLVHVQFMLDAEGANANWDYMPRPQIIKSHATAIFKPIDMEHVIKENASMTNMDKAAPPVRNTICGVMTKTALCWAKTGELLTKDQIKKLENSDDMSRADDDKIGVCAWGALYKFLFPKTVNSLIESIDDGEMFVSMERWIASYDFMIWDEKEGGYKSVPRAEAEETGISTRWMKHHTVGSKPIYRRSLSFLYGGVANTSNPAQKLSRFLEPTMAQAKGSESMTRALQQLCATHEQLHRDFLLASDNSSRSRIIAEHTSITRAIAAFGENAEK